MLWKFALVAITLSVLAGLVWIRPAPSDPARWHVDPFAAVPGPGRFVVRPLGGDAAFGPVDEAPKALLERFDRLAMATPRTRRLAGRPGEGRVTYVTRSRVFGFPDYTTVAAAPGAEGTQLAIFARQRFGRDDFGVNRRRVGGWLEAMRS